MAPSVALTNGLLRQAVYYHLDNSLHENALFFAERLSAQDKSIEPAFLLALCHLRLGDNRSAYEVSKAAGYRGTHVGCAYIFAQACLKLDLYKEGITALEKSKGLWSGKNHMGKHSACARVPHPDAAACNCLLGKLYRASDDKRKAVTAFEEALKANPFMWDAFTSLCDMGVGVKVANAFRMNEAVVRNLEQELNGASAEKREMSSHPLEPSSKRAAARSVMQDSSDPFDPQRSTAFQDIPSFSNLHGMDAEENDLFSKIAAARSRIAADGSTNHGSDGNETPTGPGATMVTQAPRAGLGPEPPQAPTRRTKPAQSVDQSLLDAPPKMSYRLGAKRRDKVQDASNDGPCLATPYLDRSTPRNREHHKEEARG
ncbi:Protein bimA [Pleurostoma richardsiae]|uniref:Protein bimA n=1 Tax=Pleurostoma richardsiae TaxID=41990 RepID=A0AA38RN11_9PEZI|nr:Protein bimA [Pleurostoma richardsiae]